MAVDTGVFGDFYGIDIGDAFTAPQPVSGAGTAVQERFEYATQYAETITNTANQALANLGGSTATFNWDMAVSPAAGYIESFAGSSQGLMGFNSAKPAPPDLSQVAVAEVEFPWSPPDPVASTIPSRSAPVMNVADPGFSIPDPPDISWPTLNAQMPGVGEAVIPEAPTITLPSVPQLSDVVIPSPPEYNIPEFDWELPTDNLTPPDPSFVWSETEYSSLVQVKLAQKLYDDLVNGGSGLPDATEQAIYDRATSRLASEEQVALDQMLDFFAGRGFDLPPGALAGQMLELNNKILAKREDINNDILIQQSKLAQDNIHFTINAATVNEKNLMDNSSAFQTRALDAAKYAVSSSLAVYGAQVEAYRAKISGYGIQAEIYKARIQGEVAKAEFYRNQILGVQASTEVQRSRVQLYTAQLGGVQTLIDLYKTEMESAHIKAQIDETKIRAFAAQVQAYSAQVGAETEKYKGYEAQVRGELGKVEIYKAQVEAYTSRVGAYKTEVEADTMVLQQQIAINQNKIEIFKSRIQQYSAQVQAAISQAEVEVKIEGLKVDVYDSQIKAYIGELDAAAKAMMACAEVAKAMAEIEVKRAEIAMRMALGQMEISAANIRAAAQVAGQMAAAAISSVSASSSIQSSESRSDSTSQNISMSVIMQGINSHSLIHQHIYTHSG